MSERYRDVLLDHLCDLDRYVRGLFALSITFVGLLFVSLTLVSPGSATFVIIVVDLVSLLVVAAASLGILLLCRRKTERA